MTDDKKKAPAMWVPALMALAAVLMVVSMVLNGFEPLRGIAAACLAIAAIAYVVQARRSNAA